MELDGEFIISMMVNQTLLNQIKKINSPSKEFKETLYLKVLEHPKVVSKRSFLAKLGERNPTTNSL